MGEHLISWKPLHFASWFPTLISCSPNLPHVYIRLCKHGNYFTFLHQFSKYYDSWSHLISSLSFSFAFLSFFVFFILFLFLLFLSLLSFFLLSPILILWDTFLQTLQFYFEVKSFRLSFSRAIGGLRARTIPWYLWCFQLL